MKSIQGLLGTITGTLLGALPSIKKLKTKITRKYSKELQLAIVATRIGILLSAYSESTNLLTALFSWVPFLNPSKPLRKIDGIH